jgi:hypothetical protein
LTALGVFPLRGGESGESENGGHGGAITWDDLAARGVRGDGPLFDLLEARDRGIDFVHTWTPPERYERLIDNVVGGGIALGDADGDGLIDVYLTRPFGGNRLYRNLGDFRFTDATVEAGLDDAEGWSLGAVFADLDSDGDSDLFVCGYDNPNRLYLNDGKGRFERVPGALAGLDFKGASMVMAFADYDLDGDLNGYLLTNRYMPPDGSPVKGRLERIEGRLVIPEKYRELVTLIDTGDGVPKTVRAGQYDHLFRNDGGQFVEVSDEAGISGNEMGLSVTWWDYNGDGYPDIYVANDFYGEDKLYRNNGDGTFTNVARSALPSTPWFSMGSDTADINNDGRLDYMASDMAGTTHYKSKVAMGEMDEQGWFLDFAEPRQYMENAVYLNTGTGRFLEISRMAGVSATDWTWTIAFGDLDNDGWADLFVSNGMTRNWFDSDLRKRANAVGGWTEAGKRLLLDSPKLRDKNLAFRNNGRRHFDNVSEEWGLDRASVSFGAALGDLDNDGDLDIVVTNFEEPISLYRNRATDGNRVLIRLRGVQGNRDRFGAVVRLEAGGVRQMRYVTPVRGYLAGTDIRVHFGLGENDKIDRLSVAWPGGGVQEFTNLPTNRFYEIREDAEDDATTPASRADDTAPMFAEAGPLGGFQHREDVFDDFRRQSLLPNRMSRLGPGVAWADVDGDGREEMFAGGASGQAGQIVGMGGGRVVPDGGHLDDGLVNVFEESKGSEDMGALFFDADRDGDEDLFVVSGGYDRWPYDAALSDRLYLNDGEGGFTHAPQDSLPKAMASGSTVSGADFDRDGDLDLFVGARFVPGEYPVTPESSLLRNDEGTFHEVSDDLAPGLRKSGLVTASIWSDVNGDGWIDLLVTHEWGPVKVYANRNGRFADVTEASGLADLLGWWNGIAGRDIDNDGDIDFVVTNFGLNTKYKASRDKPARIYYGDYAGNGEMHIVEAKFSDDKALYPVQGKSCSTTAMPHLSLNFPTFSKFALATLEEIYTPERIDCALRLEVNTLASGVLLNDGHGVFDFHPLPLLGQVAPGFGVSLTEIDGDGKADLYIAQNFYHPQRETKRMNTGVGALFTGRGDGTFSPVWPDRSGIVVPGDGKSVVAADLNEDGWVDFLVAVNDGPCRIFLNHGVADRRVLNVRLRGRRGNLRAAGARVTMRGQGLCPPCPLWVNLISPRLTTLAVNGRGSEYGSSIAPTRSVTSAPSPAARHALTEPGSTQKVNAPPSGNS